MNRIRRLLGAAACGGLLILGAACTLGKSAPETSEPLVLKAYQVPEGQEAEIERTLNNLLNLGDKGRVGKATLAPNGELLVAVPAAYHQGLEKFFQGLETSLAAPSSIAVECWLLLGKEAAEPGDLASFGDLRPALEAIVEGQGAQEFLLMERLKTTGLSGQRLSMAGAAAKIQTQASEVGDSLLLDMSVDVRLTHDPRPDFQTKIRLPEGKLLVLGESGVRIAGNNRYYGPWLFGTLYPDRDPDWRQVNLYYVVRAERMR